MNPPSRRRSPVSDGPAPSLVVDLLEAPRVPSPEAWDGLLDEGTPESDAAHLAGLLAGFRLAAHRYAERVPQPQAFRPRAAKASAPSRRAVAFAAGLACMVFAVLLLARAHPRASSPSPRQFASGQPSVAQLSDEALLQGIQRDLAQTVPTPLRSLSVSIRRTTATDVETLQ